MEVVKTRYGHILTSGETVAYRKMKKLIEKEEGYARRIEDHSMADVFRSYFSEFTCRADSQAGFEDLTDDMVDRELMGKRVPKPPRN